MRTWSRENVGAVLGYCNTVLSSQATLPTEIYTEALSVAKHWCVHAPQTFMFNEPFVHTIFGLL